jgi:cytochrome c-type protein NapB
MRREDRAGVTSIARLAAVALGGSLLFASIAVALTDVPRLTGPNPPMATTETPPLDQPITDDVRRMRAYPEQPPVIPHSIEGYQLTLNANRCLDCHRRQFVEGSGAPMISITHFMTREGQMLADVAPRRYFCTACHVQQTDAQPLVENEFRDMLDAGPGTVEE